MPLETPLPAHVDPQLVIDFDYFNPPGLVEEGVYEAWHRLHRGPDIFWTPRHGGHWVVTRAEDIKWVQQTYTIFSHEVFFIPREAVQVVLPPATVDPPNHARYRSVINPMFTPGRVRDLAGLARGISVKTIDAIVPNGRCEFVSEFARIMPVSVFLGMANLPLERREEFAGWARNWAEASDRKVKSAYMGQIRAYLEQVIVQRSESPGEDLISRIAAYRKTPSFQNEEEIIGMTVALFLGGLDTVVHMLTFIAHHLAVNPSNRKQLIDRPELIPQATEEFLRRFGLSNTGRLVKQDIERKGAIFRQGDMVMVPIGMSSMDDRAYDRPMEIDFHRGVSKHNTFGNGPHACVGATLARAEIRIFLEEWLKRIPHFGLQPLKRPVTSSSFMNMMTELHLTWDV